MLQETIAAVLAAPVWVQAFLALFAVTFVAMVIGPRLRHRNVAKRFAALAESSHSRVKPGADAFTASFEVDCEGRHFTIRRELRGAMRGSSYRGRRGHLTICETRLAGSRWKLHNVDISDAGALPLFGQRPVQSGDEAFDRRFTVWQDGVTVRDGWLDPDTRAAVIALFDSTPKYGSLWVQEGMLQHILPSDRVDAEVLTRTLRAQSGVALAFERTAGWRGPA
jgi:hypothetical protein